MVALLAYSNKVLSDIILLHATTGHIRHVPVFFYQATSSVTSKAKSYKTQDVIIDMKY